MKFGFEIGNWKLGTARNRNTNLKNPAPWLFNGNVGSINGVPVTGDTALALSAVWSAVRLLSETQASLPIDLVEFNGDTVTKIQQDPGLRLLRLEPNSFSIPYTFHFDMMANTLIWGNAFSLINRTQGGEPIDLLPLNDWDVNAMLIDGEMVYVVSTNGQTMTVSAEDMLHFVGPTTDGVFGRSVIRTQAENISMGLAAQKYGRRFYEDGTNMDGYIKMKTPLDKDRKKALVEGWNNNYAGFGTSGTGILDNEAEYVRLNMPNDDAQFIETRGFQVSEIARLFRVPLHKLYIDSGDAKANIEQKQIDFVADSMMPWIRRFEQEFNRKLLRESQKDNRSYQYNLNTLLRGDSKSRSEFYKDMFQIGAFSANEIRALENINPIESEEGNARYIALNVINTTQSKEFYQASIDSKTTNENQNGNNKEE